MTDVEKQDEGEVEMTVAGLVLDPGTDAPIVILKHVDSDVCLPIWIGVAEATSIASALKQVEVPRPMTHDLIVNMMDAVNAKVVKVSIHDLQENTYLASIEVVQGDVLSVIDARPSDGIALAVRIDSPIFVSRKVLDVAQVTMTQIEEPGQNDGEQEVERGDFRMHGDGEATLFSDLKAEDWEKILTDLDPDDFKYKM